MSIAGASTLSPARPASIRAGVSGEPAEAELVLKMRARVAFIRNDRHRCWVNGTTGLGNGRAAQRDVALLRRFDE
jgi:hypothetical protein